MKAIAALTLVGILILGGSSCAINTLVYPTTSEQDATTTQFQTQQLIKIAPSSVTEAVLKVFAEAYQAQDRTVKFEFISAGRAAGSIVALQNKIADVAGSSYAISPQQGNGQIQSRFLSKDLLVIATHKGLTGVTNLTTAQIKAIYTGDITNWQEVGGPNAEIIVLKRPKATAGNDLLRKYFLGQDQITSNAILLDKESELVRTLQDTPYSIGAFSLSYLSIYPISVNCLSLNGVKPTVENFTKGKYPMARQLNIVWNKQPSVATQKFIDFIFSPTGTKILQEKGLVPVS
ncbi:MAG: solute-binding protein [Leptolyngbyaceae cyanobacterium CRU_2_3]|nr:solute-binding protein [Leptolyngbyaceae cyanobacterium CRU_2_3]